MTIAIPPPYESTGYRRVVNGDGVQVQGRLVLELSGDFVATDEPETPELPRRTKIRLSGTFTVPSAGLFQFVSDTGSVAMTVAADGTGAALVGFFGGLPVLRPVVSAARSPRDLGLETALAALGLIAVGS